MTQEMSDNFVFWDYYANFAGYLNPFPNLDILGPALRFYRDNKFVGGFAQMPHSRMAPLADLNWYLMGKLMWNPDADEAKLTESFVAGVYGKAAPAVRRYMEILRHAKTRERGIWVGCYVGDTSNFMTPDDVIGMLRALIKEGRSARDVFLYGLRLLGLLLLSLAVYGLAVLAATKLLGLPLLGEAVNARQSLALRTAVAYSAWLKTLFRGYFAYVPTPVSLDLHILLLLAAGVSLLLRLRGERDGKRIALLALLLFLFPLSCYCLYLMADNAYIHSLALYPFASLYVLCAVLLDAPAPPAGESAPPPLCVRWAGGLIGPGLRLPLPKT